MKEKFEDLPITFKERVYQGEWIKMVKRQGTVAELLEVWDIDDPYDDTEITQVLRHLKRIMTNDTHSV